MPPRPPKPGQSLADVLPEVAAEWHPTKNNSVRSSDVTTGSNRQVWWICSSCSHEWSARISHRAGSGSGCPACWNSRRSGSRKPRPGRSLAERFPDLVEEWHPKNLPLAPDQISAGSPMKVWWHCGSCGNDWLASVSKRSAGRGCPECGRQRTAAARKRPELGGSLLEADADLARQWHPTRNGDLTPAEIRPGSDQKVWWLGSCSHEWQATVANRSRLGRGCPTCARRPHVLPKLHETHPGLAREWHPILNTRLELKSVTASTPSQAWWIRDCTTGGRSHVWRASIAKRVESPDRCAICEGTQVQTGVNDLATTFPALLRDWDFSKNSRVDPTSVLANSTKSASWRCQTCRFTWIAQIRARSSFASPCPACAGRATHPGFNDLATTDPHLIPDWDSKRNGALDPTQVRRGSIQKVHWSCRTCSHRWQAQIRQRVNGSGCPNCARQVIAASRARPRDGNSLADVFPKLAAEWHPERNGTTSPKDVKPKSSAKRWWKCVTCDSTFEATPASRARGGGCPSCAIQSSAEKRAKPRPGRSLAELEPDRAQLLHPTRNGDLSARQVAARSHRLVWWLGSCGHEWENPVSRRGGCPFCAGVRVLEGFNDLETVAPQIAAEWHPTKNATQRPSEVHAGSESKVWWLGLCGHEWQARVSPRVRLEVGCPFCAGYRVAPGETDLASRFPEIAAEWHPTRNSPLSPAEVHSGSQRKVWWLGSCEHYWKATIANRTRRGDGCPRCSRYGFNPGEDGWLYLVFQPTWSMLQIGISNDPARRLATHQANGWELLELRGPMPGDQARASEQSGLRSLAARGARLGNRASVAKFDGHTESWPIESLRLESLTQLMDWIRADEAGEFA